MSNTPCKNCIFAEYEDITQVGCSRGMIEKYKDTGATVLEAYDYDKEFYVIEGRSCPFFRTDKWLSHIKPDDIEQVLAYETILSFHVILFMNDNLDDIRDTVDSLVEQSQYPVQVTLVRNRNNPIIPKDIKDRIFNRRMPFKWRIENLWKPVKKRQAIHMVQKTIKSQYYIVSESGYHFEKDYIKNTNDAIIKELVQFAMIEPDEGSHPIVIPSSVHEYWYFHGDFDLTIPENLREYQCKDKEKQIVFKMSEIKRVLQQD